MRAGGQTNRSVLHVIRSLDPANGGPVELVRQLGVAQAAAGTASEVVTLDPPDSAWLREFPVPVNAFRGRGRYGWSKELEPWLRANRDRFAATFVHGLWQYHGRAVCRAYSGGASPYFVFPHGMLDRSLHRLYPCRRIKKAIYWLLAESRVVRGAAGVLFTGEPERAATRGAFWPGWHHESVVPLGVPAPPSTPPELRAAFFEANPELRGKRFLLFLGRLHDKKGCDLLVRAYAGKPRPFELVMAGPCADPPYLERLRALAGDASVRFIGMIGGRAKWGAYAAADAFVLPSHQENFGLAVAEALASGCPVLISDKVNIWEPIDRAGAGFVETDTPEGVARLLDRWESAGASASMRESAARCHRDHFDIARTALALDRIIASAQ